MGQEVVCTCWHGGQSCEGKLQLETDSLLFRGEVRLRIPFVDISTVTSADGRLEVVFRGAAASFDLGRRAEIWANAIRSPKTRIQKLGVKAGSRVLLNGEVDSDFRTELNACAAAIAPWDGAGSPPDADLVFLAASVAGDLKRIAVCQPAVSRGAALWIVFPKGRSEIREVEVIQAGRSAGLTDTKVVRFSDTHTALRFVERKS